MQITDPLSQRVLAYLAALARQSYFPTEDEVRAYAKGPDRTGRTWAWAARLQVTFANLMTPGEDIVEYFSRVAWTAQMVDDDYEGRVMITELGLAVSRAMEEESGVEDGVLEIVLDPDDPLAFAKAIREISAAGLAMLVEPYFRLEQVLPMLESTNVTRVLTSDKTGKADLDGLRAGLERISVERPFAVRVADSLHDRYVIPDDGDVRFIGTSLSGVGRTITVMGTLEDASETLRAYYEGLWSSGTVLVEREPAAAQKKATL